MEPYAESHDPPISSLSFEAGCFGGSLRRILTRCRRVGLAHLILRNRFADAEHARCQSACADGPRRLRCVPKITSLEQGLFP